MTGLTNGTAYTFRVTATNAVGTSPASAASNAATPQNTIFELAAPSVVDSADTGAVTLGVKFRSDVTGTVTGVRFYKAAANTGTHTGALWSAAGGAPLASATFTNESASGWQTVTFATPVQVTAGTTYVASYHAPNGHYSITGGGLANGADNAPLHALAGSTTPNGVYAYGTTSTFPVNAYNSASYGVDVLFSVPVPGAVGNVAAASAGASSANVTWTAPTTGGGPTSYRITPYAGATALAATTVAAPAVKKKIDGLTSGTTYRFTVQALNGSGGGPVSAQSNAVTPQQPLRARRADRRDRAPGDELGAGQLDRARGRRREPDHRLHDHALHRGRRPDAGPVPRHGDEPDDHRPVQRHRLHVPRVGHERDRHRARCRRRPIPRRRATPCSSTPRRARRTPATRARSSSA